MTKTILALLDIARKKIIDHIGDQGNTSTVIRVCFYVIASVLAFIQAWANRFDLYFGDSMSYLDMANYAQTGQWDKFVNGYWSPLYPLIMAVFLRIGQPPPYWEIVFVKMINLIIFIGAITCFEFFLSKFIAYAQNMKIEVGTIKISSIQWRLVGYSLFLSGFLVLGGVHEDSPDILMAALLLVAMGIALEITNNNSILNYIWLGLTLGLAYLSKTIMLPISLMIFGTLFILKFKEKKDRRNLLVAMAIFTFICISWIILVAKQCHLYDPFINSKITYMKDVMLAFMDESISRSSMKTSDHPLRFLANLPTTIEFATPVAGVYPRWYDASYWYSGLRVKFDLLKIGFAAICNLWYYCECFLFIPIVVWVITWKKERCCPIHYRELSKTAILLLPATGALLCYMVNTNGLLIPYVDRYFIAFYILLTLGLMLALQLRRSSTPIVVSSVVIVLASFMLIPRIGADVIKLYSAQGNSWWQIAEALRESGIHQGDLVVRMGTDHPYWAESYKLKVGADISRSKEFWNVDDRTRNKLIKTLKKAGFKAIVYRLSAYSYWIKDSRLFQKVIIAAKLLQIPLNISLSNDCLPPADKLKDWHKVKDVDCYFYII